MSADEHLLLRHDPCAWLPPGGVADVIATEWSTPPRPTVVVRLLATSEAGVLVVPRGDGRGLDLPSAPAGGDPGAALAALADSYLSGGFAPRLLGFVLNKVPVASPDYPWPTPRAYFAVWHVVVEADHTHTGEWLAYDRLAGELGQRHWWPLLRLAH